VNKNPPSWASSVLGGGHMVYYGAIVLNFILRILWSFKLSVHFQLSQEGLTFVLEICEVFRRFVWILFRVEWEAVERGVAPSVVANGMVAATANAAISRSPSGIGILVVEDKGDDIFREKKSPKPIHASSMSRGNRLDWGPANMSGS